LWDKVKICGRFSLPQGVSGFIDPYVAVRSIAAQFVLFVVKPAYRGGMPKLSILVLAYNVERYIAQALDSIFMQDVDFSYDVHIGNDGSMDGTVAILKKYKEKYPNIIHLHIAERVERRGTGDYVNFTALFSSINSDYFCVLDGDDYWTDPHKLQKQIDFLDRHPDFTVCGHNYLLLRPDGVSNPANAPVSGDRGCGVANSLAGILLEKKIPYMHTATIVYRNVFADDCAMKEKFYNPFYSGDTIRTLIHAERGRTKYIDEVMSVYRILNFGDWNASSELEKDARHIKFFEYHKHYTFDTKYNDLFDRVSARYCLKFIKDFFILKGKRSFIEWRRFGYSLRVLCGVGLSISARKLKGLVRTLKRS
jgi:glycosyltransferase involved in cell wall biosynthesis